ncbi:MAG: hypothetical protein DWQ47_09540 [Acidobacteria bacterium]|nr:MAG: hypothetical protein DWQ32_17640 [Acidobacteriota bacterium]REJ98858.1 MAG: hypothetical protein DWQ38_12335 [Acidobacteriota bacterium]REK16422.1 MAG: hypothetical protein DWQ43_05350 [Acidobacteriota bacterium]REK44103.1 MAG: hypothetical protein DWQ47_09540 [Acidobacteriota bacterium]
MIFNSGLENTTRESDTNKHRWIVCALVLRDDRDDHEGNRTQDRDLSLYVFICGTDSLTLMSELPEKRN